MVWQGGILSPIYFNIFVDEVSSRSADSRIGCHVNNVCTVVSDSHEIGAIAKKTLLFIMSL